MSGRAYVGTSGWSYTSWRPKFYPEGTKSAAFLSFYATRFATMEINYTFNHLPTEKNVAQWTAATPEDFTFALRGRRAGDRVEVTVVRDGAESRLQAVLEERK